MKVYIDVLPRGAIPRYEASISKMVDIATPKKSTQKKCIDGQVVVPLYKITPNLLRAAADTLECAIKQDKFSVNRSQCVFIIGDEKIGLACV